MAGQTSRPRAAHPAVMTREPNQLHPGEPPAETAAPSTPASAASNSGRIRAVVGNLRRVGVVRILVLLIVVGTAYYIAVPMIAWTKVSKVDAEPAGPRPADQPGTTYLLVGSDSREGLTRRQRVRFHTGGAEGGRADTIMLLHTGDGPNLLMSIPRASLVQVPGHGTAMINAAYEYGGPELLVETVEDATGIRVDNYIEIGFRGVVTLVNTVGGVTICPDVSMDDDRANLHVQAGCQDANGRKALAYARSRHAQKMDDVDRAAHQREVVSATGSQALSPWTFLNPARYWDVMVAGAESITVGANVGPLAFARLTLAMRQVDGSSGLTCGLPITDFAVSAVHWDQERAGRMFTLIREDRTGEIDESLCQPSGLPPSGARE
jgi:LCP family protein required for cell wall assembly